MSDKKESGSGANWWYFQLQSGFFDGPQIRRLRKKYGDAGVVTFLQLCCKSLKDKDTAYISRKRKDLGETFAEELAFDLDREEDDIKNTIDYLIKLGLLIPEVEDALLYIPMVADTVKRLTPSARRMRAKRERDALAKKAQASQCDDNSSQSADNNSNNQKQESEKEYSNSNSYILESDDCLFDKSDVERYGENASGSGGEAEAAPGPALSLSEVMELSENGNVGLSEKGVEEYHRATMGGTMYLGKPIDIPLRAMRGWAKRNRAKHPEYFANPGAEVANAKQDPEDKEGKPLPVWDSDSTNYCEFDDDDIDAIEDIVNDAPPAEFNRLKNNRVKILRNTAKLLNEEEINELGENYAALNILLKYEKKNPGILSNKEIAAAFYRFDGYDLEDFENYFRTHRA